jgi:integrase
VSPKTSQPLKSITKAWKNACKAAGVTDLRIHDLRHTFGTRAADAGAPLIAIQAVMGHKSANTTQRYTHATDQGMRLAVELASRKVSRPVTKRSQKVVGY